MRAGKAAVGRGFASYEDFVMHFDGMRLIACGFRLVTSWPQGGSDTCYNFETKFPEGGAYVMPRLCYCQPGLVNLARTNQETKLMFLDGLLLRHQL